ncbi:MAG: HEAT repeat domain-containing protein, partial [Labilithrix sp.]|nr:HEAT repeat domain-containing protein [Labilithrix sp.]
PPSSRSWADDPRANRTSSASDALEALSHSPRAESPPPMRSAPTTDLSPLPLGSGGSSSFGADGAPPFGVDGPSSLGVQAQPFGRQISISDDEPPSVAPALPDVAPGVATTLVSDAALTGLMTALAPHAGPSPAATLAHGAGVAPAASAGSSLKETLASSVGSSPAETLASRAGSSPAVTLASNPSPAPGDPKATLLAGSSPAVTLASNPSPAPGNPKATLLAGSSFVPVVGPGIIEASGRDASFDRFARAGASSLDLPVPSGEDASFDLVAETKKPITPLVVVTPDQEMKPVALGGLTDADATPLAPAVFDPDAPRAPSPVPSDPPGRGADLVLPLAQRKGTPPALPPVAEPKPMPLSEQQVSVPAHRPPSSRSDHSRILPSVIVDVASEYVALVERVLAGPDEEAETQLLRAGGYAMPAIMAKFPGPIAIEPERLEAAVLPRVAECGPVIRLIASQRRTALPFVLSHVEGPDADARFWATYLLTELVYPDAIDAAIGRTFDEDPRVRRVARSAARALAEVHAQPVVERLGEIANTQAATRRVQAIEALGETREPSAVPVLLPLLEEDIDDVVAAARAALVAITQQDFGRDTDRWLGWWEENRGRHRLEWLIDSLMHEQRALRGSASEELRTITKEYFAYYDDLPKRERERAQSRYREWWENIGRVRFSRASTRGG